MTTELLDSTPRDAICTVCSTDFISTMGNDKCMMCQCKDDMRTAHVLPDGWCGECILIPECKPEGGD